MKDKIELFKKNIEEKTGTKTFCPLPWIHVATRPNGDARLCCVTNASGAHTGDHEVGLIKKENGKPANFGKDNLLDSFNNDYMKSVRTTMMEGNIPLSCTKCFEEESNGVVSKRIWELYEWDRDGLNFSNLIENTSVDGVIPPIIRYMDLRLGHTCNLKCVMCSPHDSSRWLQDYDKMMDTLESDVVKHQISFNKKEFNNTWYEKPEFWDEVFEQIPNITQLYFAGGEPLMIKEHRRFLDEIIKRGYSNRISLRYNSNGVFVDQDIIDVWKNFKQVRYAFSIDDIGDRNHYIRFPVNWKDIENSLKLLDDTPDNIHASIACAVQVLNISHIIDFAKWKIKQNYKKINKFKLDDYQTGGGIINLHLLYIPTFLSARILPKEDKEKIRKDFMEFKQWLWDNYTQDIDFWEINPYGWKRWEAILKFIEAEDHTHLLPHFKDYIKRLDKIRNINAKEIFPEISHLLTD